MIKVTRQIALRVLLLSLPTSLLAANESQKASCGNGLLEPGESCKTCAADCTPKECTPKNSYRAAISVVSPEASPATAVTLQVSYRTNRLSIPGAKQDKATMARVDFGESASGITAANDLGYSIRLVRAESSALPAPMATVELDGCEGAPPPTDQDLVCIVEGCAGKGGVIADACTCSVSIAPVPKPVDEPAAASK